MRPFAAGAQATRQPRCANIGAEPSRRPASSGRRGRARQPPMCEYRRRTAAVARQPRRRRPERPQPAGTARDSPNAELRHLQRLSAELANARTQDAAVAATVEHGIGVFGADRAVVALLDDSREWFQMAALNGYPDELLKRWLRFPNDGSSPLSVALQTGHPVVLGSAKELVTRFPAMGGSERSQMLICLQMGQDVGGIALGYDRPWPLDEEELDFMQLVARQCGDAVRSARAAERPAHPRANAGVPGRGGHGHGQLARLPQHAGPGGAAGGADAGRLLRGRRDRAGRAASAGAGAPRQAARAPGRAAGA